MNLPVNSIMNYQSPQKVSVIMPTYNSADFIQDAIESVFAQTCPVFEIIVINDGSTDNTKKALSKYLDRIVYLEQENSGPAKARNAGLKLAKGDYIAFLDADDIWLPHKIAEQMKQFEDNPNCVMVYSRNIKFDSISGKYLTTLPEKVCSGKIFDKLLLENFILLSTVIIKKAILENVGLFNENLLTAEDTNLFLRIAKKYEIKGMHQIHVKKRQHSQNISDRYDINVGTLENLDNIAAIYPEYHPEIYPNMAKAYQLRGKRMIEESFHFGEHQKCREICCKLIKYKINYKLAVMYWVLTLLPSNLLNNIRKVKRKLWTFR